MFMGDGVSLDRMGESDRRDSSGNRTEVIIEKDLEKGLTIGRS